MAKPYIFWLLLLMTILLLLCSIAVPLIFTPLYNLPTHYSAIPDELAYTLDGIDLTGITYFPENGTYYRITSRTIPYCVNSTHYFVNTDYSCTNPNYCYSKS